METIWFKGQRVIRTAVQVIVGAAAILAGVVYLAPQVLDALADVLPGPVVAWIGGAIAALAAVSAALSRVMAIPAINAWLQKLGLGTAPAGAVAVVRDDEVGAVGMTRRQYQEHLQATQADE